jgi:ATP-dependent Lon protease
MKSAGVSSEGVCCSRRLGGIVELWNTQFSYSMGEDGVESLSPILNSSARTGIGSDLLPPGQAWVIGPGGGDENPGLYQPPAF